MTSKNLISRSIIISSVLITLLLVLLTTYIGYRLPVTTSMVSLIDEVRLFNENGELISRTFKGQINKQNIAGGSKAEIDLDLSHQNVNINEFSLYLTPIQNPILITQDNKVIQEIGDFKNRKPQKEQDFVIDLKELDFSKPVKLSIEKNYIKGSELDFIFNSGISETSRIGIMQIARSILVIYGYLAMSALFFSFAILVTVIWLNAIPYKNFGALALSFLGQSWIALYFSRIWIQSSYSTFINLSSFVIYFLSMGCLLLSFLGKISQQNEKYKISTISILPIIFYFVSASIILLISFFYNMVEVMVVYKALLTISLFMLALFILIFIRESRTALAQDKLTLILALSIILFGQINDVMRVHSKVLFMYNIGPYAFFLGSLMLIANAINTLQQRFLKSLENEKYFAIYSIAQQVSHDIRSPLSALSLMTNQLSQIPEDKRIIIRSAVNRINDISNQLLQRSKDIHKHNFNTLEEKATETSPFNTAAIHLLSPLIDGIVSEKRIQYREKQLVEIEADLSDAYGLFAMIDATELKRTISNLINNSIESFTNDIGKVSVAVKGWSDKVIITIQDNGKGIPDAILKRIGQRGFSYGKNGSQSGSGLGIYHAKKTIEDVGGSFDIQSKIDEGTTITLSFNKGTPPVWFVEKLSLTSDMIIISLDDDISIHQLWKERFDLLNISSFNIEHHTFTSGADFKELVYSSIQSDYGKKIKYIYLVDYELLNQNITGLDLIEELGIGTRSILVTSRYEELKIRDRCEKIGCKLIPKAMAGYVPVEIERPKEYYNAILIDDDFLVHSFWKLDADSKQKRFKSYLRSDDFFADSKNYDLNTPIFVDSNLGNNIKGEEISFEISKLGFNTVYLCTGYQASDFKPMPYLRGIIGKDPFWN